MKKLWALYFSCKAANPARNGEYLTKLEELERTYQRPDEQNLIPGIVAPKSVISREFWLQKIRSRLSTVRMRALFGLERKVFNVAPVLEVLRTEESYEVLEGMSTWFGFVKHSETPPYRDAPNWKLDHKAKTLTNKSEIIEYWSGRG